jgi:hypothetical protein
MIPYLIAFVVGILGGWIHAGFPLPRRRRSSPAKSEAREIGESTVTGSAPHILRDRVPDSRLPGGARAPQSPESLGQGAGQLRRRPADRHALYFEPVT